MTKLKMIPPDPKETKESRGRKTLPDDIRKSRIQFYIENYKIYALGGEEAAKEFCIKAMGEFANKKKKPDPK